MIKKITIVSLVVLSVCSAFSFADEILDKLGVRDPRYQVLNNMMNTYIAPSCESGCQYFTIPRAAKLSDVIMGDKKSLAKEACQWLKDYAQSGEFHAAYQKKRLNEKPYEDKPVVTDPETIKSYTETLENSKASLKNAKTAEEKAMWKKMIVNIEYNLESLKQAYPRTWEWGNKYPESTDSAVTRALRYYLAELTTVDFSATLTQRGKVKVFANPVYEQKSRMWKAMYRAGKEVNEETKNFVTAWLKEGVHVSTEGYTAPEEKKEQVKAAAPATTTTTTTAEKAPEKPEKKPGGFLKKIKKVLD